MLNDGYGPHRRRCRTRAGAPKAARRSVRTWFTSAATWADKQQLLKPKFCGGHETVYPLPQVFLR